jgi:4-hydroxybenzoate polyprenyltransferase
MVDTFFSKIRPYLLLMRLDKPIGSLLLLWPTLWALWIAAQGFPGWRLLTIFMIGVVVMRSAGCVINDIADRNFDGKVLRTKTRPLVTGTVQVPHALMLFTFLCSLGFFLVLQLNAFTIGLSFVGLILVIIYPFTKRLTYLPQLFLGAAYAWAIPIAFAANNKPLSSITWLLFICGVLWPVAYDTIYALMDKEDDIKIGIKSTAILFGNKSTYAIFFLQFLVWTGLFGIGQLIAANALFFGSIIAASCGTLYQLLLIRKGTMSHYYRAFQNNHWLGFIIFSGIFLNYF